jgi:hypothetical protein
VRIWTWSHFTGPAASSSSGKPPEVGQLQQASPTQVRIEHPEVASLGGHGSLTSIAPGSTLVSARDGAFFCGQWSVVVGADLSGTWTATCANGDTGSLTTAAPPDSWPSWVGLDGALTHGATGGGTGSLEQIKLSDACFTNSDGTTCTDATDRSSWLGVWEEGVAGGGVASAPSLGACSSKTPCYGITIPDCDATRHVVRTNCPSAPGACPLEASLLGPDHFAQGSCNYTRGSSGKSTCGGGVDGGAGDAGDAGEDASADTGVGAMLSNTIQVMANGVQHSAVDSVSGEPYVTYYGNKISAGYCWNGTYCDSGVGSTWGISFSSQGLWNSVGSQQIYGQYSDGINLYQTIQGMPGTVQITETTPLITGTFSFVGAYSTYDDGGLVDIYATISGNFACHP